MKKILTVLALLVALVIAASAVADVAAVTGVYTGRETTLGLVKYADITYATAERWQAPVLVAPSEEKIDATAETTKIMYQSRNTETPQQENELTLDIYVNPNGASEKKGVFVWNTCGGGTSSNSNAFDPSAIVAENPDVIAVVVNIRVSYFGCIDLSGFADYAEKAETYQYSNNLMRLDYVAALKWINQNIAAFGGDPENVTIAGQSAGAANASTMLLIADAHPYFSKVIMESGVAIDRISLATMEESRDAANIFMEATGVSTIEEALNLPYEQIIAAEKALTANCIGAYLPNSQSKTFASVIDNVVVFDNYWETIEAAAKAGKTILVGSTNGEYDRDLANKEPEEALAAIVAANWGKLDPARGGAQNADKLIQSYVDRAEQYGRDVITSYKDLKNDINQKDSAYIIAEEFSKDSTAYLFSYAWYTENADGLRATHGSEKKALYPAEGKDSVPAELAVAMRSAWAAFVLTGNPNDGAAFAAANVEWKPYNTTDRWDMVFDTEMKLLPGQRLEDIETLLPLFSEFSLLR